MSLVRAQVGAPGPNSDHIVEVAKLVDALRLGRSGVTRGGSNPLLDTMSEEPEAYRIGWVPFIHTKIWLDSRPLIPRPETEYWVEKVIEEIKHKRNLKVLDLCAGSGAIGVAILKEIPDAQVNFVEKEIRHHSTIEKNLRENGLESASWRILGGDLFQNVTDKYDVILTNPPYINPEKLERVQKSVLDYEPHEALMGGEDGMETIKRILEDAPYYLNPDGLLFIEHEPEQAREIAGQSFPDQYGVIRYSRLAFSF